MSSFTGTLQCMHGGASVGSRKNFKTLKTFKTHMPDRCRHDGRYCRHAACAPDCMLRHYPDEAGGCQELGIGGL